MTTTNTNIQSLKQRNHHKTTSFEVFKTDHNDSYSYGSSSSSSSEETADQNSSSPESVFSKVRKCGNVFRCHTVRNQIERIRAEDSYLGEDIAEYYCLIAKACGVSHDHADVMMFSRPASPLSGKVASRISLVQ